MTTTATNAFTAAVANGVSPVPFTFQAISAAEVGVLRAGVLDLAYGVDFSVTLNGDSTGAVTPAVSWGTDPVVVYSKPAFNQPTNFTRFGAFYPDQMNPPLDRLARAVIALRDRAAYLPIAIASDPTGRAGKVLGFSALDGSVTALSSDEFRGPAGGNVMSIGLLKDMNGADVLDADLVHTSGNEVLGQGTADYVKDNSVDLVACPKAGFTDAGGQKYRIVGEQPLNSQQFYDATDGSYGQCIQRGLDYLRNQIGINGGNIDAYRGSVPFRVPAVRDDMTTNIPIDIYHSIEVFGDGSGDGGPYPAKGCTHIHGVGTSAIFRIQHPTTFGDNGVDVAGTHPGVGRAKLHGFMLTNDAPTDRTKHGVIHRGIADIYDIYGRGLGGLVVRNWTGDFRGFNYHGNTSTSSYARIKGEGCQGTFSIGGTDSNVIQTDGCQGYQNQQFGFEDANAAGANKHRGMHCTFNGMVPPVAGPFSACSQGGNIYTPNLNIVDFTDPAGTSTLLNAHAPTGTATSNAYWVYAGPGGVSAATPAYASGGPWIYGGDMLCMTPFATEWDSCYMEGGGLPSQSVYRHPVWNGGTIDRSQLFGGTLLKSTDAAFEIIRNNSVAALLLRGAGGQLAMVDFDDVEWLSIEAAFGGATYIYTPSSGKFRVNSGGAAVDIFNWAFNGINLEAGKVLNIGGVDVLNGQMAAIADLAGAPTQADFNGLLAKLRGVKLLHA